MIYVRKQTRHELHLLGAPVPGSVLCFGTWPIYGETTPAGVLQLWLCPKMCSYGVWSELRSRNQIAGPLEADLEASSPEHGFQEFPILAVANAFGTLLSSGDLESETENEAQNNRIPKW